MMNRKLRLLKFENSQLQCIKNSQIAIGELENSAYKEISVLFQKYVNKDSLKSEELKESELNDNPFEIYQEWLLEMIDDLNNIAQFEGLNTILIYFQYAKDIKTVALSILNPILDKININKPNFKEIVIKIIETIYYRGMENFIIAELTKRFNSARNNKISEISMNIVKSLICRDVENIDLKQVFHSINDSLTSQHKNIRDISIQLLKEMFVRIEDDSNIFVNKLKNIKPIIKEEILSLLIHWKKHK